MRVISFFIGIGNVPLSPGDKMSPGTILSLGDNFLEFCPFVPEIAKFVPFYGDKFGDISKINFVPK
jgi:hypothetical protein